MKTEAQWISIISVLVLFLPLTSPYHSSPPASSPRLYRKGLHKIPQYPSEFWQVPTWWAGCIWAGHWKRGTVLTCRDAESHPRWRQSVSKYTKAAKTRTWPANEELFLPSVTSAAQVRQQPGKDWKGSFRTVYKGSWILFKVIGI